MSTTPVLRVRHEVDDAALSSLHATAFGRPEGAPTAWASRLERYAVTWVGAFDDDDALVGFVQVTGDGGEHGFLLDTVVHPAHRRRGLGTALVAAAAGAAAEAGCSWLHVDFEPHLTGFYRACGFGATEAGLMRLDGTGGTGDTPADRAETPVPALVGALDLEPHPEGGWFGRTWTSPETVTLPDGRVRPTATLIHYLLPTGQRSAWHRVASDETWLAHLGSVDLQQGGTGPAPVEGEVTRLGTSVATGEVPQVLVPAGVWQRTLLAPHDVLVSCLVSPGFDYADFELAP